MGVVLREHSSKFMGTANKTLGRWQRPKGRVMIWFLTPVLHPTSAISPEQSSREPIDLATLKAQERKFQSRREKTLTSLKNGQDSFAL